MRRALLLAAALPLLIGAAQPEGIDYRLKVTNAATPVLEVDIRMRGDRDGETRLLLPPGLVQGTKVTGARVQTVDTGHLMLRQRVGAKLSVRYQVRIPDTAPGGFLLLGEAVFATPEGRAAEPASFRWSAIPPDWRTVTDLEPGPGARPLIVANVQDGVILAGPGVQIAQRDSGGSNVRTALVGETAVAETLANLLVPVIIADRRFWRDPDGPFLIAAAPITGPPRSRTRALIVATGGLNDPGLRGDVARSRVREAWPRRVGNTLTATPWLTEGLAEFVATRIVLQRDLMTPLAAAADLAEADASRDPGRRGTIMALKWDEDIRRKSGGKLDLSDVVRHMADHHARFAPGEGPDALTGLISAAWVVAGLDLRPDIARYADPGQTVRLPAEMFDGCLQARVTLTPGFDAGFNVEASFAAKRVQGVRRRGPAWNSGLRDGMALDRWTYAVGDRSQMIELTVRPAGNSKAKARTLAYWAYGDATVETRRLQLTPGMSKANLAACGPKLGGR